MLTADAPLEDEVLFTVMVYSTKSPTLGMYAPITGVLVVLEV